MRERAVRLVQEHRSEYPSPWVAVESIACKIGGSAQTLSSWVKRHEVDSGQRDVITTSERERIKESERENRELRRTNELKGGDFSALLKHPQAAQVNALRPAALFNYNMLAFQDANWAAEMERFLEAPKIFAEDKIRRLESTPFNLGNRGAIRSIFDGRYRFSRYFSPTRFNTPKTYEEVLADNDLEVYDLQNDPEGMNNLARELQKHRALIMALNEKLNDRLTEEVGVDDGSFLPIRDGTWYLPKLS